MKKILVLFFVPFLGFGQNCQFNEVVLQLNTGDWASEVSWSITDSLGNLIDSTSQTYLDSTTYYGFNPVASTGIVMEGKIGKVTITIG